MNIFVLDECPVESAILQCDKHVVKMIVETAQLLSTAHRMLDGTKGVKLSKTGRKTQAWILPDEREDVMYKACHFNHPSAVWARESEENYRWLYVHFVSLCDEYTYRYGKKHMTDEKLAIPLNQVPKNIPKIPRTQFKLAMGTNPECMHPDDPVRSYREYYVTKKDRFKMSWTKREIPEWFKESP